MNFIVFIGFLFLQYFCKENESQITFTVTGIRKDLLYPLCMELTGKYLFVIEGKFSSEPNMFNSITFNLLQPVNAQVECTPISISSTGFSCDLPVYDNNILKGNTILLQLSAPKVSGFIFKNWETIIGATPGTSNKVAENVYCSPSAEAIFNVTNIESNGCNGNKNVLKLNGKWSKEIKENVRFELVIDGYDKKADCTYDIGQEYVKCLLEGYGNVKINEKYSRSSLVYIYLVSESNNTIHVDKCNDGKFLLINSFIFYLLINLLFI